MRTDRMCLRTVSLILVMTCSVHGRSSEQADADDLRRLFVLANLEFTVLHEFSHTLIDELKLPVFGMEEDAADRIAIVAMLMARQHKPQQEIVPWLFAVAGDWYAEWELRASLRTRAAYWDSHRLEIQRFHNVVCLVYGSNPDALDDLMDTYFLPFERAMNCEYEYQQARQAVEWLLEKHGRRGAQPVEEEQIGVSYEQPLNPANERMLDWLKQSELLDKLARVLSANFKLPRKIRIEVENCGTSPDAFWHQPTGTITVCYELLTHFLKMAEHRLENPGRACHIPTLRKYMGTASRCESAEDEEGK